MIFLSQDQIGSRQERQTRWRLFTVFALFRFLQRELPSASASEQQRYFQEISQQALTIASDVFGNFIIQVLLESNNLVISRKLIEIIKSHMMDLSTRPYGCRVVQKAIETLPYDGKKYLAASLEGNVESCAHNEHGNHVLQRCLHHIQAQDIAFAYSTIADRTRTMSKDRYGCRVVQRAIENGDSGKLTDPIRRRIVTHAVEFASDEFANFVVQKLLLTGTPQTVERMAVSFMPHLRWLSCQKYPSNVVETLLSVCSLQTALRIKLIILGTEERHSDVPLTSLMRDRFGRYVLEKLIKVHKQLAVCLA